MRQRSRATVWLPVFGVAMLGVVVGHSVTYLVAVPALVRSSLLLATGHAYWSSALSAGLLAGMCALGGVALRRFRVGLRGVRSEPVRYLPALWRLAVLQVLVFSLLEIGERSAAGVPLASMFQDHIYPVGVAVQVVVAAVGALLLLLLARGAEALATALSKPRRQPRLRACLIPRRPTENPDFSAFLDAYLARGPPPLAISTRQ